MVRQLLSALTVFVVILSSQAFLPQALAQDEDLDLEVQAEDSSNFDDIENELNQPDPSQATEQAEPPPPTIEEEKPQQAEESIEIEAEPQDVAEPAPPAEEIPPPAEEAPESTPEEQKAEVPPPPQEEAPAYQADQDIPDDEFEARLSRIYKQFYSQRTSDEEWVQIAGPKVSEKYVVQPGDTLWGISQTFFGNGFFWPKLWQLNSDYTNPHILEVSDSIQFSPGTVASEPVINLTQINNKFNEPEMPPASVTPEQAKAYMANVEMPPPYPFRPVINNIPKSLPKYNSSAGFDDIGFSIEKVKRFDISDMSYLTASVSDANPPHDGQVIEAETGASTVNVFQEAVVELDQAQEKDRFYAFHVGERISNEHGAAYPITYEGEVEVIESLGDNKYRVLCLQTVTPIVVGSLLRKGGLPQANYSKGGTPANVAAKVFGGDFDPERKQLGMGNLIYISGGRDKGLQVGQLLTVLKDFKLRNANTNLQQPKDPIGLIKIVDVADGVATALVLESREDIRPGDLTGPGDIY